jgi:hypothetical protein
MMMAAASAADKITSIKTDAAEEMLNIVSEEDMLNIL